MTTHTELLPTGLSAGFFTLSGSMALLLAFVCAALESPTADLATADFVQPAWLVLENTLATQTRFGGQESTFRTSLVVLVAAVVQLRMATILGSLTLETAWRWFGTAG